MQIESALAPFPSVDKLAGFGWGADLRNIRDITKQLPEECASLYLYTLHTTFQQLTGEI